MAIPLTAKPLTMGMRMPKASMRPPTRAKSFNWRAAVMPISSRKRTRTPRKRSTKKGSMRAKFASPDAAPMISPPPSRRRPRPRNVSIRIEPSGTPFLPLVLDSATRP